MQDLKVIFMGTPVFSVPILEELIKYTKVIGVITSPDAYVGRKRILTPCPVKETALKNDITVYSPSNIKEDYGFIKELKPDIIITCAYGQIVPEEVLNIPRLGCINIHASLLPKYRGGAPIHYALINGESKTGITLMYMDKGMDTGDIIKSEEVLIDEKDNLASLSDKLRKLGAKMIIEELPSIIKGTNQRIKQNDKDATYARIIKREDEHLDFNSKAVDVYNKVRALSPEPLANFILDENEYKIGECEIVDAKGNAGQIVLEDKKSFTIMTQDKGIKITKIKPMGKNLMNTSDFKNGYHDTLVGKWVK
jgi:methionyl-tRNA formyltransferase